MDFTGTMYPLIINSSGLQPTIFKNAYRYTFPQGSVKFQGSKVAISNINMYYSWFNITATNQNNTISILWPSGAGSITYNITIPDGYYDVAGLNQYIQQFCITNALYLIDPNGDFVYYLELAENSAYYAVQFNAFPFPTALPLGWSAPVGLPAYPSTARSPQLVVNANAFRDVIGFNAGTYPAVASLTNYSKLSDFTPQVTPVQSIIVACTLLNNKYSNPNTILYSFTPRGTQFGGLIEASPTQLSFIDIQNGSYPYFDLQFLDQNFQPIYLNDTNLVIQLLIHNPN